MGIPYFTIISDGFITKGQIISEQICGVLKFSKKATKYCQDFCPSL